MAYDNASKATAHASTTYDVQTRKVVEATNWESDCSTKYSTKVGNYESASTSSVVNYNNTTQSVSKSYSTLETKKTNFTVTTNNSMNYIQLKSSKSENKKDKNKIAEIWDDIVEKLKNIFGKKNNEKDEEKENDATVLSGFLGFLAGALRGEATSFYVIPGQSQFGDLIIDKLSEDCTESKYIDEKMYRTGRLTIDRFNELLGYAEIEIGISVGIVALAAIITGTGGLGAPILATTIGGIEMALTAEGALVLAAGVTAAGTSALEGTLEDYNENTGEFNDPERPIYKPSPKHDPLSGWGSPNPIPDIETGQYLLDTAYSSKKLNNYTIYINVN